MVSKIKLFDPMVDSDEQKAILKVLKSHFWASGAGGRNVSKFENLFKNFIRSDDCVAVNSGTSALNLALSLVNIKNKEVILPSLTFVSTAHAVLMNGGKPKFVDVDENLCLDPNKIKKSISKNTRVILPVHFAGMPCNLDEITKICNENSLVLIEDAAHAIGSTYKKNKIGSHGFAVCFSFHPVKNLAMPTGGIISLNASNHRELKNRLLSRRWCGITERKNFDYDVKEIGWNYYMNEFSAAIGIVQLKKLNKMNRIRKMIAKKYSREINLETKMQYSKDCSYHIYWVMVNNRKNFMLKMSKKGIEAGIHYKPVHTMSMYKQKLKLPKTEKAGREIVSIPIHPNLTNDDIEFIIKNVNDFC